VVRSLNRSYLFLALALLLGVSSCNQPQVRPLICPPPPEPICTPGTFDKILFDTIFHGVGHWQNHITMLPAPINSAADDYAITFIPSSGGYVALISSDRASVAGASSERGVQRFYSAPFISKLRYGELKMVEEGTAPVPIGAGFYSKADNLFYFSAKAHNTDPDDFDLYTATLHVSAEGLAFSDVRELTALNSEHHFDSQPTLDATGTRIYFISDRPGGMGGTDIWYSERTSISSADWSEPRPLPEPVNSACDELSPYIPSYDPHTLYFASNGHATVGGYDLFKTRIIDGRYSEPENLGKPINTQYDETFPVALNDTAFFWSSNMPSSEQGMNLYTTTRSYMGQLAGRGKVEPEQPNVNNPQQDTSSVVTEIPPVKETTPAKPLGSVEIVAHVTRGAENRPAAGSDIFVRKDSTEIFRGKVPATGQMGFKVNRDAVYDVGAETEDAFFDVKQLDLRGSKDSLVHVYLHLPDTLVIRINFPFDDYQNPYEFTIDENGQSSAITWQQALDLTAHSALQSLDHLKQLVLIGHTDSLGSDAYNDRLGYRRATFVALELEKRGVPARIIKVESRGRTQPVARRPGESDELFRLRSRRVEFIKVFQ